MRRFSRISQCFRPGRRRSDRLASVLVPGLLLLLVSGAACDAAPRYPVVIDPGHGGYHTAGPDDKWDPVTGDYLSPFYYGAVDRRTRRYREHILVLDLSQRVKHYLDWTREPEDWPKFQALLREFTGRPDAEFERIILDASMSRTDNYRTHEYKSWEDRNAPYRLYDYPDKNGRMRPGRISEINQQEPYLVLSLHMNPAPPGHPGGMAAVLAPGYATFAMIRDIHLGKRPMSDFEEGPWHGKFLVTDYGWTQYQAARADASVYFNGFRTSRDGERPNENKNRGIRSNLISWRYAEEDGWERNYDPEAPGPYAQDWEKWRPEGPFWDRERGQAEEWRREGGPLGYGGDNHYASDELMRFVQYGVRKLAPELRGDAGPGPINKPFVSTYSMPTLVNAVNAYLEIGYIDVAKDRELVIAYREEVARSLAVGVYSLFRGIETERGEGLGPYYPRGEPVQWERYEELPEGNYFKIVDD